MAILCPNLNDPKVVEQFNWVKDALDSEDLAYELWDIHQGDMSRIVEALNDKIQEADERLEPGINFDAVEKVSNMIVNKLSIANRPLIKRNLDAAIDEIGFSNDEALLRATSDRIMQNVFGFEGDGSLSPLNEATTEELKAVINEDIDRIRESGLNLERSHKETLDQLYKEKRVVSDFLARKDLSLIDTYHEENQSLLRTVFKSLFEDNKFKSEDKSNSVNIKLSMLELGSFIYSLNNEEPYSTVHKSNEGMTSIKFGPFQRGDSKMFGLSISRNKQKYSCSLTPQEAEVLKIFCQSSIYESLKEQ